jgi:hypothetical protein
VESGAARSNTATKYTVFFITRREFASGIPPEFAMWRILPIVVDKSWISAKLQPLAESTSISPVAM